MQHIAPIHPNLAGPATEILDTVKKNLGSVPNIFATLANSPSALGAYLDFSGALDSGRLDKALREQIALTVAGANGCDYCASAHTFIAKSLGVEAAETARNLAAESADVKTAAILRFAANVVNDRAIFADNASVLDELHDAGVTDGEVIEIIANVALNIFTNYFNHIAGTEIDFPVVDTKASKAAA